MLVDKVVVSMNLKYFIIFVGRTKYFDSYEYWRIVLKTMSIEK